MKNKILLLIILIVSAVWADKFDKFMSKGRFKQALEFIEKQNKPEQRVPEEWYKIGMASEKLEMYEKAISCYLSAIRMSDNFYDYQIAAARVYNVLGQYTSAYVFSKKALNLKTTEEANWEFAKSCYKLSHFKEAKEVLVQIMSNSDEAKNMLADIYFNENNIKDAVPLYEDVFLTLPDTTIAEKLSNYYVKQNDCTKATRFLEYLIQYSKSNEQCRINLARCYYKQDKYLNGLRMYEGLSENKFEALDYYYIGLGKEVVGQIDAAEKFFAEAANKSNDRDQIAQESRMKLAVLSLDRKDFKEARLQLEKLNKTQSVLFLLAQCYEGLDDYKQSGMYAEQYLKFDSTNVKAKMILATSYEKRNYKTKAEELRQSIVKMNANDASTQLEMGKYYFEHGLYTQAIKFFDKSYLIEQDEKAAEMLALCSYRIEQYDKAKDAAESAIMRNERSIVSREILYKVLMRDKRFDEAAKHLEFLVMKINEKMEYLDALVTCYQALNQKEKLIKIDERIVEVDQSNENSRRRLAIDRVQKGMCEDALNFYSQLTAIQKVKVDDYSNMINCALKLGLKDRAIDILRKYSSIKSNDAVVYKWLADVCFDTKKYDEALNNYRSALQYNPELKGVYKNFATILIIKNFSPTVIIDVGEKAVTYNEANNEVYVGLGNAYMTNNNFKRALELFILAQRDLPKDLTLLKKIAVCQVKIDDVNSAIVSYEQLVALDQSDKASYKVLAQLYDKKNDEKQAISNYKKYSATFVEDDIVTKIAMYEYNKQNYVEAVKYFVLMKEFSNQTKFAYGESLLKIKDYANTVKVYEEFVEKYPEHVKLNTVNKYLGIAYDNLNNVSEAILHYSNYVSISLDSNLAYRLAVLQEKVNLKDAEVTYKTNISKFAKDYRNYYRLGTIYKNELNKSRDMYEKAAELNDTLLDAWLKLGQIYHKLNDEDNKIRVYKKVIALSPQNFEANKYLGMSLYLKGKLKESILYLELARNQNFNDAEVLYTLALCYIPENKTTEVIMLLQSAKNLKRDDANIRYVLANQLQKLGQLDKAIYEMEDLLRLKETDDYFNTYIGMLFSAKKTDVIEKLIKNKRKKDPENIDLLMTLAKAQSLSGKIADAIESYKMILIINPVYVNALYERANLHYVKYDFDNARLYFEKVISLSPKSAMAELGLAKTFKALNDKEKYLDHLRRAQELDPKNSEILKEVSAIQSTN